MILKMILKSLEFQCDFDFDFQITTSRMILILNHLYLGDLILKSSTYDDFAHLCSNPRSKLVRSEINQNINK